MGAKMKARRRLGHATGPQGGCLELFEHDGAYTILWDGQILMDSRTHTSEYQMGHLGLARCEPGSAPRILIGGLGLGYTLKGVLEKASPQAVVEVVECVDTLKDWNHRFLQDLNGHLLKDERVSVTIGDVGHHLRQVAGGTYDVILLDVDNGPVAMVDVQNASLYSLRGLQAIGRALAEGGRMIFWSASQDAAFEQRLGKLGFKLEAVPAKRYPSAKRAACVLYVADHD